jgi:hypothetical protein
MRPPVFIEHIPVKYYTVFVLLSAWGIAEQGIASAFSIIHYVIVSHY